jgi:hypothetical protein
MRFSQRIKKVPIKTELQVESIDDDLRIGLWNIFSIFYLEPFGTSQHYEEGQAFFKILYLRLLKLPVDTIPDDYSRRYDTIRKLFFEWEWYRVFDFIEFVAQTDSLHMDISGFVETCNTVLGRELSGYRFVDGQITPITNESELSEIEEAIEASKKTKLSGVHSHLESALAKLSDRKSPDYRNSIKELSTSRI